MGDIFFYLSEENIDKAQDFKEIEVDFDEDIKFKDLTKES